LAGGRGTCSAQEPIIMRPLDYLSFDLLLESVADDYRARVIASPGGEAKQDFDLATLAATTDVQTMGAALFNALFVGAVGDCLTRAWQMAHTEAKGLRIRLRIDEQAPALANLPWETLYWTQQARFLALSVHSPIVRYIEQPRVNPLLAVTPPLRLLALIAAPTDLPALDSEHEWRLLETATAELVAQGQLVLERLVQPTLPSLQERLRQGDIHLLHFMGHGLFDAQAQQGSLFFEDGTGHAHKVDATTLAILLHDYPPRLIFLNACQGASSDGHNFFAGVAQKLVQAHIPAVIAMQAPISDPAAITLTQTFYKALAAGYPVDAALAEARKALYAANPADPLAEWATPILFSRAPDNRLFALDTLVDVKNEVSPTVHIDTDGGTYIDGNVTVGGDLIGRDKIVHGDEVRGDKITHQYGFNADEVVKLIETVRRADPPASVVPSATAIVRKPFKFETILIAASDFAMGDDALSTAAPRHSVYLPTFRIAKGLVTNRQYAEFIRHSGRLAAPELAWNGQMPADDQLEAAVTGVTFTDALLYCQWLCAQTGDTYCLPHEAAWERAATSAAIAWGAAREWTCSLWGEKLRAPDARYAYPWQDDDRNDPNAGAHLRRVVRGGTPSNPCARSSAPPDQPGAPGKRYGFRVFLPLQGDH